MTVDGWLSSSSSFKYDLLQTRRRLLTRLYINPKTWGKWKIRKPINAHLPQEKKTFLTSEDKFISNDRFIVIQKERRERKKQLIITSLHVQHLRWKDKTDSGRWHTGDSCSDTVWAPPPPSRWRPPHQLQKEKTHNASENWLSGFRSLLVIWSLCSPAREWTHCISTFCCSCETMATRSRMVESCWARISRCSHVFFKLI